MGKTPKGRGSQSSRPYNYRRHPQGDSVGQRFLPENYSYSTAQYMPRRIRISPYHQYRDQRIFGGTQGYRNRTRSSTNRGQSRIVHNRRRKMQPQVDTKEKPVGKSASDVNEEKQPKPVKEAKEINVQSEAGDKGSKIPDDGKDDNEVILDVERTHTPKKTNAVKETKTPKLSKSKASIQHKDDSKTPSVTQNDTQSDSHMQNSDSSFNENETVVIAEADDTKVDETEDDKAVSNETFINHENLLGKKKLCLVLPQLEIENETVIIEKTVETEEVKVVMDTEKLSQTNSSSESFHSITSPLMKDAPRRSSRLAVEKSDSVIVSSEDESESPICASSSPDDYISIRENGQNLPDHNHSYGNNIRSVSSRRPLRNSANTSFLSPSKSSFNYSSATVSSPMVDRESNSHISRMQSTKSNVYGFRSANDTAELDVSNNSTDCSGISDASNVSVEPPPETEVRSPHGKRKADILDDYLELKKLKAQQSSNDDISTQNSGFLSIMSPLYLFKSKAKNERFISSSTPLQTIDRKVTVEKELLIVDDDFNTKTEGKEFLASYPTDTNCQDIKHRNWCSIM